MKSFSPFLFVSLSCLLIGCQEKETPPSDLDQMVRIEEEEELLDPASSMNEKALAQEGVLDLPELIIQEGSAPDASQVR